MSNKEEVSEVEAWVSGCREAYAQTKRSSLEAASYLYLIWRASCGSEADQAVRADMKRAIDETNCEMAKRDGRMKKLRVFGLLMAKGKSIEDKEFEKLPDDDRDKFDARYFAALSLSEFKNKLSIPIEFEPDKPALARLAVTKHALLLETNRERSRASRYAKVLEWIDGKFSETSREELDFDKIVESMDRAGGFEEVLVQQRNKGREQGQTSSGASSGGRNSSGKGRSAPASGPKNANARGFSIEVELADAIEKLPETGRVTLDCFITGSCWKVLGFSLPGPDPQELTALQPEQDPPPEDVSALMPTT